MRAHSVHAYIVPSTDAHMNEYISKRDARLGWLTGFTGSAGTSVVTQDKAALWTDSRYWTQAERELDCNWELQRTTWIESIAMWILEAVPVGGNISLDPFLFSIATWNSYNQALQGSGRILLPLDTNLVDQVWGDQRPPPSSSEIYSLPAAFTGSSWQEKVAGIRQQMEQHVRRPTAVLLSGLEETAWLFNLRGDDIPYNPVFYSYTLLTITNISLFVEGSRLAAAARESLRSDCPGPLCVELREYGQVSAHLSSYTRGNVTVWLGTEYTTYGLYGIIPQVRDAVAVIQYLLWLEKAVPQGQVNEFSGAQHIDALRWAQEYSHGPSFESISASGLNAALAHYRYGQGSGGQRAVGSGQLEEGSDLPCSPSNESSRTLSAGEMYLFDTGGQYLPSQDWICWGGCPGTTVLTRPVPPQEAYTRVLMGNIDLSRLVFPSNTAGPVGFQSNNVPLVAGMFTSIEPGYYRDGEFGIRIEDVALVVEAQTKHQSEEKPFLTFEVVSLVPYDRKLIDLSLLSPEQIQYLNSYYKRIRERVGPELRRQQLEEEFKWLQESTKPFPVGSSITTTGTAGMLALTSLLSVLLSALQG
ncbi:Xaa-Pro aminopeptidase 2 [Willisornis vidua]|uniref:Xaa-Pro aminopeptidase 2 n=1 Tax=Willisornis vidua TaxID=1566151 RepID=A0ABQ9DA41_9PASS|nr:Xaa-Pro aminopeptidase 2 [Willisornis vidua]